MAGSVTRGVLGGGMAREAEVPTPSLIGKAFTAVGDSAGERPPGGGDGPRSPVHRFDNARGRSVPLQVAARRADLVGTRCRWEWRG